MDGLTFLHSQALLLAWMDGRESVNSSLAILFCIRNRINEKWEDGDLGRILQGIWYERYYQNTPGGLDYIELPDLRDPVFNQLLGLVESIFDPENPAIDRLTNGGTRWGDNPVEAKERVAVVGTLNIWR